MLFITRVEVAPDKTLERVASINSGNEDFIRILITSILIGFQDNYFIAFNIMGCFALVAVVLASQIQETGINLSKGN